MFLVTASVRGMALALAALVVALGCERSHRPAQPSAGHEAGQLQVVYDRPIIRTMTPAEKTAASRPAYATADNKAYFDKFKADLAKRFEEAIAAHKEAKAAPIHALARACKKAADDLNKRSWSPKMVQVEIEPLVDQLRKAGEAIPLELRDSGKELRWQAADRIEGKARSTVLELDNIAWLEAWQKLLLNEFGKRVDDAGL